MWVRAVWKEGEKEEEGVIPDNWVQDNCVLWPPVADARKSLNNKADPQSTWKKFPLIKIKIKSDKRSECEMHDFTSTMETSDDDELVEGKRSRKKRRFEDYITEPRDENSLSSNNDHSASSKETASLAIDLPPQPTKIMRGTVQPPRSSHHPQTTASNHAQLNSQTSRSTSHHTQSRSPYHSPSSASNHSRSNSPQHSQFTSQSRSTHHSQSTASKHSQSNSHQLSRSTSHHSVSMSPQYSQSRSSHHSKSRSPQRSRSTSHHAKSRSPQYSQSSTSHHSQSKVPQRSQSTSHHSQSRSPYHSQSLASNHSRSNSPQNSQSMTHHSQSRSPYHSQSSASNHSRSNSPKNSRSKSHHSLSRSPRHSQSSSTKHPQSNSYHHSRSTSHHSVSRSPQYSQSSTSHHSQSKVPRHSQFKSSHHSHNKSRTSLNYKSLSRASSTSLFRRSQSPPLDNITSSPLHSQCLTVSSTPKAGSSQQNEHDLFPMPSGKFQKRVLMLLTDIRHELTDLKRQSVPSSLSVDSAEIDIRPAETLDDFHELENRCSNTQERKKLAQILSTIGGVDAKDNVKKIMERLMHNSLMALFSMKGRSTKKGELGKLVFQKSSVYEVVQASAFKTNMREGLTIQDVYKFAGDCLRYAPDRRGGGGRK